MPGICIEKTTVKSIARERRERGVGVVQDGDDSTQRRGKRRKVQVLIPKRFHPHQRRGAAALTEQSKSAHSLFPPFLSSITKVTPCKSIKLLYQSVYTSGQTREPEITVVTCRSVFCSRQTQTVFLRGSYDRLKTVSVSCMCVAKAINDCTYTGFTYRLVTVCKRDSL